MNLKANLRKRDERGLEERLLSDRPEDVAREEEIAEEEAWLWELLHGRVRGYLERAGKRGRVPRNVGARMREEQPPPEQLVDGWLVRGLLHWVYSDAEAGKTWLALVLAEAVLRAGGTVLWVDEELGVAEVARRLVAVGGRPEDAERGMLYLPHPGWGPSPEDVDGWGDLLRSTMPDLVVIDTATDALASANVDENSGREVTTWVKAYPEQATQLGATVVVLDHVGKGADVGKHAVGSRAKRAKAKVQWALKCTRRYDRDRTGEVRVTLTKNTEGAHLEASRTFRVGGDGEGRFLWEEPVAVPSSAAAADGLAELKGRIVELLRSGGGEELTTNQVNERVSGSRPRIVAALSEMVDGDGWPIRARSGARNSTLYRYEGSA